MRACAGGSGGRRRLSSPVESYFSLKEVVPLNHFPHPARGYLDEEVVNQDLVHVAAAAWR